MRMYMNRETTHALRRLHGTMSSESALRTDLGVVTRIMTSPWRTRIEEHRMLRWMLCDLSVIFAKHAKRWGRTLLQEKNKVKLKIYKYMRNRASNDELTQEICELFAVLDLIV
jgi:hypothetical protein